MVATTLTYFDFNGGRGEDCRLALHIAGAEFEDDRVKGADWGSRKDGTPFHNLPFLVVDGKTLGQSNAILGYIGRTYGLHPTDPWEAAQHEALMNVCEELRHVLGPTLRLKDADEKKAAREAIAAGFLQQWGADVEACLGDGPFLAGDAISVADLKLFVVVKWFDSGVLDHIPTTVFESFPKLTALYRAVKSHDGVVGWYAAR